MGRTGRAGAVIGGLRLSVSGAPAAVGFPARGGREGVPELEGTIPVALRRFVHALSSGPGQQTEHPAPRPQV
ncbi:hypothetical protein GCM10022384_02790 [Streptomyces marokkonensis]|uniref:Uncharacterized protein n=1 Tax=Streptomyces marokkonensis TaxID=324855 RepID=A0ABP7NRK3_9ACTN